MSCLGNVLWFLTGGVWQGLSWTLAGVLWCVTIVGIPIGRQCFKLAGLAFFPFGKTVSYGGALLHCQPVLGRSQRDSPGPGGCGERGPALRDHYRHPLWDAVL